MSFRSRLFAISALLVYSFDALALGHACFYGYLPPHGGNTLYTQQYFTSYDAMEWNEYDLTNCYHNDVTFGWYWCDPRYGGLSSHSPPGWTVWLSSGPETATYVLDSHFSLEKAICDPEFGQECMYFYWPGPNWYNVDDCDEDGIILF